ncbi:MAG: GGDEF domain-containing protein, partial [Chitinivibrionales bacterium]|nr:GGDEF domain-containing protein [Chitinivibrionales bacterium]
MMEYIEILEMQLAVVADKHKKIDILNDLAWLYRGIDKKKSKSLCQQAHQLALSDSTSSENYLKGMMYAVRTLSYIGILEGAFNQAMVLARETIEMEKKSPDICIRFDSMINLFWCWYYQAMYAEALDLILKVNELLTAVNDPAREAVFNSAIGILYREIGPKELAVEKTAHAIEIYRQIKDWRGLAGAYNNLAYVYQALKKYELAIENAKEGIKIVKTYNVQIMYQYLCDTIGEIYLEMNDFDQALHYLEEQLQNAQRINSQYTQLLALTHLGDIYHRKNDIDSSIQFANRALSLAEELKDVQSIAKCHELLSQIYEKRQEYGLALNHLRTYHTMKEITNNEETDKKLSYLKTIHEAETANRNAEIYRLKNIALKKEIEEQKQIQSDLEEKAFFDPLTGLFNRRQAMILLRQNFDYALSTQSAFCVMMIDIDQFKQVNDTFGHAVGDEVLSGTALLLRRNLRQRDVVGRFGGEEFVLGMRLSPKQSMMIAKRICESFSSNPIKTNKGDTMITVSIGLSELHASKSESV